MVEIAACGSTNFHLSAKQVAKADVASLIVWVSVTISRQEVSLALSLSLDKLRTLFIAPQSREKY